MFFIRPAARRDLEAYTDHLVAQAGVDVANRFIDQARATFAALEANPKKSPAVSSHNQRLAGLRKWRVDGFPKVLIFYIPTANVIHIIRVTHVAQDWWSLLDVD